MTKVAQERRELDCNELDHVCGGSVLNMILDAAEKYMQGVAANLDTAVHQPITSPPTMSLHMR